MPTRRGPQAVTDAWGERVPVRWTQGGSRGTPL